MPLTDTNRDPIPDLAGFRFQLQDQDGKAVVALVTREALHDVEYPPEETLGRFEAYRDMFAEIASDKFDQGMFETDGSLWVRHTDVGR